MDIHQLSEGTINDNKMGMHGSGNPHNDMYGLINTYPEKVYLSPDENILDDSEGLPSSRHPCKCDKSQVEFRRPVFNYCKFSSFLQTKSLIERHKRIRTIELDEPVLQVSDLTDDLLLKELTNIYGSLDSSSELFLKLFQNYKLERKEQIEIWCLEEKEYYASKIAVGSDNVDLDGLSVNFTPDEVKKFGKVSDTDSTEYFVLPRRIPSGQEACNSKRRPTLNTFDPELHIPFIIPPICEVNVGEILARGMHEIVKNHPTGMTCSQFMGEFEQQKSYRPNAQSMNYGNFMEMIDDLSHHIILVQKCDENTILYPMFLQGLICSLDEIFSQIFHKVKVILNLSYGILKLNEALKICETIFGWNPIDFKAWGFRSEQDFVLYLAKRWKTDRLMVVSEDKIIPKGNPQNLYLLDLTEERKELLKLQEEKLNFRSKVSIQPSILKLFKDNAVSTSIPRKFMQPGQSLQDEMSMFKVGDVLSMVVTFHVSPTDFYMVENSKFEEISELNKKLKVYCEREESINGPQNLIINPTLISPGYCCILIDEDGEYHRAEYLKKEGDSYRCRLLDYGDTLTVGLQNLRYLDIKLATKIPTQAFHCKLIDVIPSKIDNNNGTHIWTENIKDFSYNLMVPDRDNPQELKVFLKEFLIDHSRRQRQWIVWMCDRKRKIKDFGATLRDFISKNVSVNEHVISSDSSDTKRVNTNTRNTELFATSNIEPRKSQPLVPQKETTTMSIQPHPFVRHKEKVGISLEDFPPLSAIGSNSTKSKQKTKWKK